MIAPSIGQTLTTCTSVLVIAFGSWLMTPMSGPPYLSCNSGPFTPQEEEPEDPVTIEYRAIPDENHLLPILSVAERGNVVCASTIPSSGAASSPGRHRGVPRP
jgi:hypothetical protein